MIILKIDPEFQNLIPPLSDEEYRRLEDNIKADGCRDALVIWDGTIVDGHNRYEICQDNNIEFRAEERQFSCREEAIVWMLQNQLGRRNLNDFQRNEVAQKFQTAIAKQMKERQRAAGGDKKSVKAKIASDQLNRSDSQGSTLRRELANIAGTSEGSVQRSMLILDKGTPEQIERARKGGKGNSVYAISKEITGKAEPVKIKPKMEAVPEKEEQADSAQAGPDPSKYKICSCCHKWVPLTAFEDSRLNEYPDDVCGSCIRVQLQIAGKRMKSRPVSKEEKAMIQDVLNRERCGECIDTIEIAIEDFQVNFQTFLASLDRILKTHLTAIKDNENNKKIMAVLSEAVSAMEKMKGKYSYERL